MLPGVRELLLEISERDDVLIGLLTGNFREGARIKLEHHSLHHHFCCGGYGDHHLDRDDVARKPGTPCGRYIPKPRSNGPGCWATRRLTFAVLAPLGRTCWPWRPGCSIAERIASHSPNVLPADFCADAKKSSRTWGCDTEADGFHPVGNRRGWNPAASLTLTAPLIPRSCSNWAAVKPRAAIAEARTEAGVVFLRL